MSSPAQPRRSSRRQSRNSTDRGPLSQWRNLSQNWRQHYVDLGHCRIARCTRRLIDASDEERDELQSLNISFVAQSITSAASTSSGKTRKKKEDDLMEYIRTAHEYNLPINDDYNGDSAVELAAYHGLSNVLVCLLDMGYPLRKERSQRNALYAAVRNGQHTSLEIILSKRMAEAKKVVDEESLVAERTGHYVSTLAETILKGDITSMELLLSHGCAWMSDLDAKTIFHDTKRFKRHKKLERLLKMVYPTMPKVMHWQKELHWSFPKTDRDTLNWLWHALQHPSNAEIVPNEMWLRVFSFFGRGWFTSRMYGSIGYHDSNLSQRNIIDG